MTLHEADRWYLPPKGNKQGEFSYNEDCDGTKKKKPIIDCYKTAGDKIYDFWTCNFTHPQGMFLPSLTLSQEFSLTVLLREVTEEPQLLSARQESVSKLFSHGNKILNIY